MHNENYTFDPKRFGISKFNFFKETQHKIVFIARILGILRVSKSVSV